MKKKDLILNCSQELFFLNGVKSVTIDNIAKKCRVSKKTIYQYFENKSDILLHILNIEADKLEVTFNQYSLKYPNALTALQAFLEKSTLFFNQVPCGFLKEIKEYYPSVFFEILKLQNNIIIPFLVKNIDQGKQEKIYKISLKGKDLGILFNTVFKVCFTENYEIHPQSIKLLHNLFLYSLITEKGFFLLEQSLTDT